MQGDRDMHTDHVSRLSHTSNGSAIDSEEDRAKRVQSEVMNSGIVDQQTAAEPTPTHSGSDLPTEREKPTEIAALRSLASALADSVEAYEIAAREGEELFRPIFLSRSKAQKELINEIHARILALGGTTESEFDESYGFASSMREALNAEEFVIDAVEQNEAKLRSLFQNAIDDQAGDSGPLMQTHLVALENLDDTTRQLHREMDSRPR